MKRQRGFTLLEMLVAMAIFSVIVAISYRMLAQAGDGFRLLDAYDAQTERSQWTARQLRADVDFLALSQDQDVAPLRLAGGGATGAQLWLLVRDMNGPTLMQAHYFIDEKHHALVREVRSPWAKQGTKPMQWQMLPVDSFEVQAMDASGSWTDTWEVRDSGLPTALRVRWSGRDGRHELVLPLLIKEGPA